ncbi:hypothetical protein LCGC14_0774200 [marine sediment metagenome]|uniref:Uncharacterized protein n=1 Tax=marine sediment metagenome TaxID=412755 RepID=A0A0F9QHB3_9ZZZZ
MHLDFITRGVNHQIELFKIFMQAQMFPFPRQNLNVCECGRTKEEHEIKKPKCDKFVPGTEVGNVQGALRPIQLWEYVFPRNNLQDVLSMMNLNDYNYKGGIISKSMLYGLRKSLKCVPLPKLPFKETGRFIDMRGLGIDPIGIHHDDERDWPEIGYHQEIL